MALKNFHRIVAETPQEIKDLVDRHLDSLDEQHKSTTMLQKVSFFPNGTTSFFDDNGQIETKIENKSWVVVYLEYLERQGVDPTTIHFEAVLNDGRWRKLVAFKSNDGQWSYRIEDGPHVLYSGAGTE